MQLHPFKIHWKSTEKTMLWQESIYVLKIQFHSLLSRKNHKQIPVVKVPGMYLSVQETNTTRRSKSPCTGENDPMGSYLKKITIWVQKLCLWVHLVSCAEPILSFFNGWTHRVVFSCTGWKSMTETNPGIWYSWKASHLKDSNSNEPHHGKTSLLRTLSLSYQKEGLVENWHPLITQRYLTYIQTFKRLVTKSYLNNNYIYY